MNKKCQYCDKDATTHFDWQKVCESHYETLEFDRTRFDDEKQYDTEEE